MKKLSTLTGNLGNNVTNIHYRSMGFDNSGQEKYQVIKFGGAFSDDVIACESTTDLQGTIQKMRSTNPIKHDNIMTDDTKTV